MAVKDFSPHYVLHKKLIDVGHFSCKERIFGGGQSGEASFYCVKKWGGGGEVKVKEDSGQLHGRGGGRR